MSLSSSNVSVIMPCYQAEATIGEALESVFAQTAQPLEVLVIDDRCRDKTVEIARRFGSKVRVMTNPQRGPGAARRLGVTHARGEYIAHVDADDRIAPTKHEKQLNAFEGRSAWTVVHTSSSCFADTGGTLPNTLLNGSLATGQCTQAIFETNPVCGASTMWRRSVLLELGNYDADMLGSEDYLMSLLASPRCEFIYLDEPLYFRRRHATNITNNRALMTCYHWLAQERFQRRCPESFATLPDASIETYMIAPVIRAAIHAYWQREGRDYSRLLDLALRLAPENPELQMIQRRRWCPMACLRLWDRLSGWQRLTPREGAV